MNVEIFSLCDGTHNIQGKLSLIGAFDSIKVKEVPFVHPHCAIALRLRFSKAENGRHSIKVDMFDKDGKRMGPELDGGVVVKIPKEKRSTSVNLCLGINNLKVEKFGRYKINLLIDGKKVASLPLAIEKE